MKQEYTISDEAKEEIDMKLRILLEVCQIHKVPMFACVALENREKETIYDRIVYHPTERRLADDQIRRHICIANGFEAVPKRNVALFEPGIFE